MPVFGLAPQAVATPGGFAEGFSNLGAAFLNAPMEQRKLNMQQKGIEYQRAFEGQKLAQESRLAGEHNQTLRDVAKTREEAMLGVADTKKAASQYASDARLKAAEDAHTAKTGYAAHEAVDRSADVVIKNMPKSGPGSIPGIPEPIGFGTFMGQTYQVEQWRAREHAKIDAQIRAMADNAGDPQPDKPAPAQGPGQPNMAPPAASPVPPAAQPGAAGARPQSAPQAFGAPATGQAPGGKTLTRSALRVRVQRGHFPNEAAAQADAEAHGFTITGN